MDNEMREEVHFLDDHLEPLASFRITESFYNERLAHTYIAELRAIDWAVKFQNFVRAIPSSIS